VNTLGQMANQLYNYFELFQPHDTSTSQTDGRTDGRTTCRRNTALCVASRGKDTRQSERTALQPLSPFMWD